ncbi:hypothetical protein [Paracoccus ravus]|uniref:hypothetical protein n=1 Tax=Paracoccus ravus TaxID=2447760 RepID=UPI00106F0469|nr:hypothetical protein [Paracoccus ravus]
MQRQKLRLGMPRQTVCLAQFGHEAEHAPTRQLAADQARGIHHRNAVVIEMGADGLKLRVDAKAFPVAIEHGVSPSNAPSIVTAVKQRDF